MNRACPDDGEIQDFVAGQAAAGARERIEVHIGDCDGCRMAVAELARARGARVGRPSTVDLPGVEPMAGLELGRYLLGDRLGAGGMGLVYRARDALLDRDVAVKVVGAGGVGARARDRLLAEARSMARLAHPNVVAVFDAGFEADELYVTMELVQGRTFGAFAREESRSWREIVQAGAQAARGLAAAHAAGVLHCDVNPDNILVDETGRVRVTDFGLARGLGVSAPASGGTPGFLAPEVGAGAPPGEASDQFALCRVLEQALAARGAPARVGAAIARGLDPDPSHRHQGVGALADALERAASPPGRVRILALSAGAAACVALVALAIAWLRPGGAAAADRGLDCAAIAGRASAILRPGAAAGRAGELLSSYVARWRAAREQVCRAGDRADRQVLCLENAHRSVSRLAERLASGDRWATDNAVASIYGLPAVDRCASGDVVSVPPEPPRHLRARVAALREELNRAGLLRQRGRERDAAEQAARAAAAADRLGYEPLQALARFEEAVARAALGEVALARAAFEQALRHSERKSSDVQRASVLGGFLMFESTYGDDARRFAELADKADALAARLGNPLVAAEIQLARGQAHRRRGEAHAAVARFEEAVAIWQDAFRADHPNVLTGLQRLGDAQLAVGDPVAAERSTRAALEMSVRLYGAGDLETLHARLRWASVVAQAGRPREALPVIEEARDDLRRVVGRLHPAAIIAQTALCRTLTDLEAIEQATVECAEALAAAERTYGSDSVVIRKQLGAAAELHRRRGELPAARRRFERALALFPADGDPIERADLQGGLAMTLARLGARERARARALARSARTAWAARADRDSRATDLERAVGR